MSQRLSIVIVNWNQTAAARECLRRLAGWHRLEPEIWLVDNASSDEDPRALEREFQGVRFVFSARNLGWGGGNNEALRRLEAPYVLLLNTDAWLDEESAGKLVARLDDDPRLAVVAPLLTSSDPAGRVISAGGRDVSRHIRTHLTLGELERDGAGGPIRDVEYVPGAAACWRTAVLRDLGWFEESYFFGGEIAEMCERARERGHRVGVAPTITASHDLGRASRERSTLYPYYILRNRFLFIRRRRSHRLPLFAAWSVYGLLKAGGATLRGDLGAARLYSLGLLDGLRNRSGDQNARVRVS